MGQLGGRGKGVAGVLEGVERAGEVEGARGDGSGVVDGCNGGVWCGQFGRACGIGWGVGEGPATERVVVVDADGVE